MDKHLKRLIEEHAALKKVCERLTQEFKKNGNERLYISEQSIILDISIILERISKGQPVELQ